MANLCETIMLLCFGLSWPISLIKNIRAGSARGMSLPFILLITAGYLAGIAAKLLTQSVNYVLIVYFINLLIVSLNLAVYIRNYRLDQKQAEQA